LQKTGGVSAGVGATAEIVAQVVLTDDLENVAATGFFGENAVEHFLCLLTSVLKF